MRRDCHSPRPSAKLRARLVGLAIAWMIGALGVLLSPRVLWAQAKDAGARDASARDASTVDASTRDASSSAEAGVAPSLKAPPRLDDEDLDAGTPSAARDAGGEVLSTQAAASGQPQINIPATEAERAEGTPIAKIEVTGNRRVAKEDVL